MKMEIWNCLQHFLPFAILTLVWKHNHGFPFKGKQIGGSRLLFSSCKPNVWCGETTHNGSGHFVRHQCKCLAGEDIKQLLAKQASRSPVLIVPAIIIDLACFAIHCQDATICNLVLRIDVPEYRFSLLRYTNGISLHQICQSVSVKPDEAAEVFKE